MLWAMLMFTWEDHERVRRGEVTVTWRLWKYAHVKAGRVYPTGFGFVEIDDVRPVAVKDVTGADAREAGLPRADDLVELARSHTGAEVSPDTVLHRVEFRYLGEEDPRPPPPRLGLEAIAQRLARLDAASPRGPWTTETLRLIEENPQVVARKLAAELDWPTLEFKVNVRKLKALGLTISYPI